MQTRVSSTRLPNKVIKNLEGLPMFVQQAKRILQCKKIDKLIVITSTEKSDDILEAICKENDLLCFRGDLYNVLSRYYYAQLAYPCEHAVRVTADCPVIDSAIMELVINTHLINNNDYTSNCLESTFPDGLDTEVISKSALQDAYKYAKKPSELEHVTPYIRNNPQKYQLQNIQSDTDLSNHRWTVDEPEDFELISAIYAHLYAHNCYFNYQEILNLLSLKPELSSINAQFSRNEGMLKSLKQDKEEGYE